jgi:hypothetical protein
MHFLNSLDRDIEIVIRKKPRSCRAARMSSLKCSYLEPYKCIILIRSLHPSILQSSELKPNSELPYAFWQCRSES